MLSWTVIECCRRDDGHLEKSEEYEFTEDSDYEGEYEQAGNPGSGDAEASCEEKQEQELLPVLKIGSLVA